MSALRVVHTSGEKFKSNIDRLSLAASDLLATLPELSEEEVIRHRKNAAKLGGQHLRVEVTCDAEIWTRDQVRRNREVGAEQSSISAAIVKRAREIGCSPKTIKRNAKIYFTFKEVLDSTVQILPDKGYYQVALESADPIKTLNQFLERKQGGTRFSVSDAARLLLKEKREAAAQVKEFIEANRSEENKKLQAHIERTLLILEDVKRDCPNQRFGQQLYGELSRELREHLALMLEEDVDAALIKAWQNGYRKEDQMAQHTGLTRVKVHQHMKRMEREGIFFTVPQGGETEMAKGGHAQLWHLQGEPYFK